MTVPEAVFEKLKTMSVEDQEKVLRFVDSLARNNDPAHSCKKSTPYPLRGSVIRFKNPTEPVAEDDWEALR